MGSLAFTAQPRTTWIVTADPDDHSRRILSAGKNNLIAERDITGLAFEIVDGKLVYENEPVNMTADECLGNPKSTVTSPELDKAVLWMQELFEPDEPIESKKLDDMANQQGINIGTLRRAKNKLQCISFREAGDRYGKFFIKLPLEQPPTNSEKVQND